MTCKRRTYENVPNSVYRTPPYDRNDYHRYYKKTSLRCCLKLTKCRYRRYSNRTFVYRQSRKYHGWFLPDVCQAVGSSCCCCYCCCRPVCRCLECLNSFCRTLDLERAVCCLRNPACKCCVPPVLLGDRICGCCDWTCLWTEMKFYDYTYVLYELAWFILLLGAHPSEHCK